MNKRIIATFAAIALLVIIAGIPLTLVAGLEEDVEPAQTAGAKPLPDEVTLDYANWSYLSLVLRDRKFLEEEFRGENVKLNWVLTPGGNKSMEFLLSGSVDVGTGAGVAGILSFVNGNPIKAIYVTHLHSGDVLVRSDSDINDIADLKGRDIAATPATNPYLFLLRALHTEGLRKDDVNIIPLQHQDGALALLRGDVDAWSGGDRLSAAFSIGEDAEALRSIYNSYEFNTPCFLYARNEFQQKYPEAVRRILSAYDKARKWALSNPDGYVKIVARENKVTEDIARLMVADWDIQMSGEITDQDRSSMVATEEVLRQVVREDIDIGQKVDELLDRSAFRKL